MIDDRQDARHEGAVPGNGLWAADVTPASYVEPGDKYLAAVLEQYKLYVEMADRVSGRRALANTFFLTLNTTIFTAVAVFWGKSLGGSPGWLALPLAVLIGQCGAWFWLLRSYRLLNEAKYRVIGDLETRLPAAPYSRAEWNALGRGENWRLFAPMSSVEQIMPVLFALVYVLGFVLTLVG